MAKSKLIAITFCDLLVIVCVTNAHAGAPLQQIQWQYIDLAIRVNNLRVS